MNEIVIKQQFMNNTNNDNNNNNDSMIIHQQQSLINYSNFTNYMYNNYTTFVEIINGSRNSDDDDNSNINDFHEYGYSFRYGIFASILLSFAYSVVFVVGISGNVAVFIIVQKSPKMRTLTNRFISNLAIADLLVNIFCLPFTLAANLIPAWSLGAFFCKMVSYLQGVSVSASVNTLMAISIERCIAISCPLSLQMTSTRYRIVIFTIWCFALALNIPWLFVFTIEPMGNGSSLEVCIELWPSERTEHIYFIIANLILCYLGPLTVISICYILIWCKVTNRNIPGDNSKHKNIRDTINKSRLKVTKMVFVVIITFALSWLPLYILFCVIKFEADILENENAQVIIYFILPLTQWLGASNSCINPILYAYMNRKFRRNIWKFFKSPCCFVRTATQTADDNNITLRQFRSESQQRIHHKKNTDVILITNNKTISSFRKPSSSCCNTNINNSTNNNINTDINNSSNNNINENDLNANYNNGTKSFDTYV